MSAEKPLAALRSTFAFPGEVKWIGIRPAKKEALETPDSVEAIANKGLAGDRYTKKAVPGGKRQVTLIQAEHIEAMAAILRREHIDPGLLRRNIVVSGINLQGLKEQRIRIGKAVLEITGPCHPCSRMEENLGPGGYSAMRGHGGWCCKVVEGGEIRVGDSVKGE